jgi:flagellar motor switch protein FliN/FliY
MTGKSQIDAVKVEITVVLGRCSLPMNQLLKMGRGAVIPLDATEHDQVWILANGHPIARGDLNIQGEKILVAVTEPADAHEFSALTAA